MRSRIFVLLALVVSLLALTACGGGSKTIKIAVLAPLSGGEVTFGESTRDGVLLAMEEWNAKGGIDGKPIEVIVEDSQCNAEVAVSAANKVIDQDGVKFIIGEVCSSASIPISEIATAKSIFQISPTSTNTSVTVGEDGATKPTVFRACFIDPFQGKVGAKFALGNLGAKTAAVFFDQGNDYVRGLAEVFIAEFEAGGGKVLVQETYTGDDSDFSAILTKVKDANPDVLYLPDYYSTVNLIAAQAKEKGITAVMLGGDGWDSVDLDRTAVDGGYFTNHFSAHDTRSIVQDFVKKYTDKYGAAPDALAALAYDAANILFQGIDTAGKADPVAVSKALEAGTFAVVSGDISYDAQHNPVKAAVVLQVKDGQVNYIATVAP
ncbi:MAG TPA: ABC transporter substrate-binding protein [Anaerolineae bacterium]|nr:ABC transporter substrate-binding protein [Anaerolineae bacterium]HQH37997.1 ABC transporter substrate-binding protein [Anaerolineae bacterium]